MGVKVDKMAERLGDCLGYGVWLVKRRGGYEVQEVATGNFISDNCGENLRFKNLSDVKGYIEEENERNEWKKAGLQNA